MRIALITTNQMDVGIRTLSGILKDAGHSTILINLSSREDYHPVLYPQKIKDELRIILADCEVVGISISDLFLKRAQDLAKWIKSTINKKVILGGIHAQLYPEECIATEGVDAVCIGEGVKTICSLLSADDWDDVYIDDFWLKRKDGTTRKGNLLPMLSIEEMNTLPLPDYSYNDYWLLNQAEFTIESMVNSGGCFKIEQHQVGHPDTFVASFMLGCINKCSYCNITALSTKWHKECPQNKWYRIKPINIICKELELIKQNNPNMKFMCIMDNDFTARSTDEIKDFFICYKRYIDMPAYLMVSPNTLTEEKLKLMIEGGLKEINLGIQTNETTNTAMYDRPISNASIIEKANLINNYKEKIYPFYDLLIFNKQESNDSLLKTIDLIKKLPLPFDIVPHHLTLGPEVPLYKTFLASGRMSSERADKITTSNYHEFNFDDYSSWDTFYLNLLIEWMGGPHNQIKYGRLPRSISGLLVYHEFNSILANYDTKVSSEEDTLSVLTTQSFMNFIKANITLLKQLNSRLGNLRFSNQE